MSLATATDVDGDATKTDLNDHHASPSNIGSASASATSDPASAVTRVLGTTELLERILLALTFRRLLRAQRINKTFLATILQSVQLRRVLYLEPVPVKASSKFAPWYDNKSTKHLATNAHVRVVPIVPFGSSYYDPSKRTAIIRFGRNGLRSH
ncbi:hypothetical protein LTR78_001132 [Recurvomyces mirabilis]|uniref:F-box domain-containing protein n=1 Tax=Recurvomyces mirabilis TaxID=574656 RepID=A0AAE0WVJ9_9PEZI|nr:hypothetical protein LTR78_001132 [Recurvomyces mirabilis]KAK5161108.1 hypothetical protein LTS14_000904 [Recurvomyces mirabilis]